MVPETSAMGRKYYNISETTTVNEGGSRIPAPRMRNVSGLYTIKLAACQQQSHHAC